MFVIEDFLGRIDSRYGIELGNRAVSTSRAHLQLAAIGKFFFQQLCQAVDLIDFIAVEAVGFSIFFGEKLLTTGNPSFENDLAMLAKAGLEPLEPDAAR